MASPNLIMWRQRIASFVDKNPSGTSVLTTIMRLAVSGDGYALIAIPR